MSRMRHDRLRCSCSVAIDSESKIRWRRCASSHAGVVLVRFGFRERSVESQWTTADNRWSQIIVGKRIVQYGPRPLRIHGPWRSKIRRHITPSSPPQKKDRHDHYNYKMLKTTLLFDRSRRIGWLAKVLRFQHRFNIQIWSLDLFAGAKGTETSLPGQCQWALLAPGHNMGNGKSQWICFSVQAECVRR